MVRVTKVFPIASRCLWFFARLMRVHVRTRGLRETFASKHRNNVANLYRPRATTACHINRAPTVYILLSDVTYSSAKIQLISRY